MNDLRNDAPQVILVVHATGDESVLSAGILDAAPWMSLYSCSSRMT